MNPIAKIQVSIVINQPPEEVFAYVTNHDNDAKWRGEVLDVRKTSEGPVGVGTTYLFRFKSLGRGPRVERVLAVTAYQPNAQYAFRFRHRNEIVQHAYTFERVDGSTRVTQVLETPTSGLVTLIAPFIMNFVKKIFEQDFAKLKILMEVHAV